MLPASLVISAQGLLLPPPLHPGQREGGGPETSLPHLPSVPGIGEGVGVTPEQILVLMTVHIHYLLHKGNYTILYYQYVLYILWYVTILKQYILLLYTGHEVRGH